MFGSEQLIQNLETLDKYYLEQEESPLIAILFSKLAILELCGWIESYMQSIAQRALDESSFERAHSLVKSAIDRTYGFDYGRNLEPLFATSFGATTLARFEVEFQRRDILDALKSELGSITKIRNRLAHSYTSKTSVTQQIDAPHISKRRAERLLKIFEEISDVVDNYS